MQKITILALVALLATVQGKTLTSKTFEHTTQASTGQTTGIWVVRFCSKDNEVCQDSENGWNELKEDMLEQQIFLADVDVDANGDLAQRFQVDQSPTYVMLRRRKMFVKREESDLDHVNAWILENWSKEEGLPVPPEKAGSQAVTDLVGALRQQIEKLLNMNLSDGEGTAKLVFPVLGVCLGLLLLMLVRSVVRGGRSKRD